MTEQEKQMMENEEEQNDDLVVLEDENGNLVRFDFLELVNLDDKTYAVLLPLDDNEDSGVVFVEVVDLGKETEHYDSVTDEALNDRLFEAFRTEFKDRYEFD